MSRKFIKVTDIGKYKIRDSSTLNLVGFKKLNIFVGENNSGKSRFLRQLLQKRENLIDLSENSTFDAAEALYKELCAYFPTVKDRDQFLIKDLQNILKPEIQGINVRLTDFKQRIEQLLKQSGDISTGHVSQKTIAQHILNKLNAGGFEGLHKKQEDVVYAYIPILRGLRPVVKDGSDPIEKYINEDCYKSRTIYDYFRGQDLKDVVVFTGLDLYEQIRDMLLSSTKTERDFVRQFEIFLSKKFFNEKEVILTPAKDTDVISVSIGGEERPIFNLGDGIQSIICNVFLAYKNKDKNLILFIEEPEVYLHPGMQRTLVEVLLSEIKNVQIFITTHSNHFLDLIYDYEEDVSIFSLKKQDEDYFIANITKNREVIDILGVRNSSVYLSNCVIWLEGVSDRIYIKKFLELYMKAKDLKFKEDYHYALSEYGGSNIENFDFIGTDDSSSLVRVRTISDKNLIIADNDGEKGKENKKGKRLSKLETLLGKGFIDDYIEVENLIPYKIYSTILEGMLDSTSSKAIKLKERTPNIEEKFNKDILTKKIGTVVKKYLIEPKDGITPTYFEYDNIECIGEKKKDIANMVIQEIEDSGMTFDDLPEHTKAFVEKVITFIKDRNIAGEYNS